MNAKLINLKDSYSPSLKVIPFNEEPFTANFLEYYTSMENNKLKQEEYIKKIISDFLQTIYTNQIINISGRIDLAIMDRKQNVQVLFEVKSPVNKSEMPTQENLNRKAFQELVSYYMYERIVKKNNQLKHCIITNGFEWFSIDALQMDKFFYRNNQFYKLYSDFIKKRTSGITTTYIYEEIKQYINLALEEGIKITNFNLDELFLKSNNLLINDKKIKQLYYFLSPENMLKEDIFVDSNALNKDFYNELLYLMGLDENKGKKNGSLIQRLPENKRQKGSLIESTIDRLQSKVKMSEEKYFEVAMQLSVLWMNRLLFLKLLESQLIEFNNDDQYKFLSIDKIKTFQDLFDLFFSVLAKKEKDRSENLNDFYKKIPYLNSSLFEEATIEKEYGVSIDTLRIQDIKIFSKTSLLGSDGRRKKGELTFFDYLFKFFDTYNFSTAVNHNKETKNQLINASVLGLIFEKINGYKDGSFFTPGKITMYMTRTSIRNYVIKLIHEKKGWDIKNIEDIIGYISSVDIELELSDIINNITICDPAVGSGHFLVSALNELISIKSELHLLKDSRGKPLSNYQMTVINDELIITDLYGQPFKYFKNNKETVRVQKAIFEEKKKIIENSLFGVDINQNSVNICRLRLWIELLKSAYYDENNDLTTLPNIDINIKKGNSLISRYKLDSNVSTFTKRKMKVSDYLDTIHDYINTNDKSEKAELTEVINSFKTNLRSEIYAFDPKLRNLRALEREYNSLSDTIELLELSVEQERDRENRLDELSFEIKKASSEVEKIKNNKVYEDAFEWRFEFPQILDAKGNFIGFDIIIGNPPYIYRNANLEIYKPIFEIDYYNNDGNPDLYKYFIELSYRITKTNGINCLITNSSFLHQKSFKKTREFLYQNTKLIEIYPLGPNAFQEATVDTVIYLIQKKKENKYKIRINIAETMGYGKDAFYINPDRFNENEDFRFDVFLTDYEHDLIKKVRVRNEIIEDKFDVGVGINTGYIKNELTSMTKENDKYHPMVNGKGISHYGKVSFDGYIKYDPEFVKSKGNKGRTLPDEKYFNQQKILIVRTRNLSLKQRIISTIDSEKGYNLNRLSNIIPKYQDSLYGLIGWLNSSFYNWIFTKEIVDYEIKPVYLKKCPIGDINDKILIDLTSKAIKTEQNTVEFIDICRLIDKRIYELLKLDDDEIVVFDKYSTY